MPLSPDPVAAVVLAAGQSRRMGRPKMTLPWGDTTVIGQVVQTLHRAGVAEIVVVVVGGAVQEVEKALSNLPARIVVNPDYAEGEMLSTLQVGLKALSPEAAAARADSAQAGDAQAAAALVTLGDQPQVEVGVVELVISSFLESGAGLVVPSYQNRRGHPWLAARSLWPELLALQSPETLRDFLRRHAGQIQYVSAMTDSVLADIDTPEDYQRSRPKTV